MIERIEMNGLFRASMHPAIRLLVGRQAVFQDLHHAFTWTLGNGAGLRAVEGAGGPGADGFDYTLHAFLTVMASQSRIVPSLPLPGKITVSSRTKPAAR